MRNFNITQTYVNEDDPWLGIISAAAFTIFSTTNMLKCYSMGQLVFVRDIIPLINNKLDWELLRQQKQAQMKKDNIRANIKRDDHY